MNAETKQPLTITILVDNPKSWIVPFAAELQRLLQKRGHEVALHHTETDIGKGYVLVLLGCEKIVPAEILRLNAHNIVVHPSDLPSGQGFSPLTWLILEGKNDVPITLFEAVENVDSGPYYFKGVIHFEGHELNEELKRKQGEKTVELALKFFDAYPNLIPKEQKGEKSWYRRRSPEDSELEASKSIGEQFDLLRVVDNERYPAFFRFRGSTYILKIFKKGGEA